MMTLHCANNDIDWNNYIVLKVNDDTTFQSMSLLTQWSVIWSGYVFFFYSITHKLKYLFIILSLYIFYLDWSLIILILHQLPIYCIFFQTWEIITSVTRNTEVIYVVFSIHCTLGQHFPPPWPPGKLPKDCKDKIKIQKITHLWTFALTPNYIKNQSYLFYIWYYSMMLSMAHFTNNFSITIQMWWKFLCALIPILIQWSLQYLAHGTTAGLSWHVPNFVAIWSPVVELELNEISIEFELWWKNR